MENEPDTENVVYLDEYPELKKRVWLRNLHEQRRKMGQLVLFESDMGNTVLTLFEQEPPDGAA
jgi:hypothetical protein